MPSPAGHLLAGVAIAWGAEAAATTLGRRGASPAGGEGPRLLTPLVLACAALAVAPDLDILLATHRTVTHSLGAVVLTALASAIVARAFGSPAMVTGALCGLTVAGHVVLDWLGRDSSTPRGVMALWPISAAYFYSGVDLFAEVSRRYWKPDEFILRNAVSVAREVLILGPVAALAWWARRRRFMRSPGWQRGSGTA
jgi:inner membrane protein